MVVGGVPGEIDWVPDTLGEFETDCVTEGDLDCDLVCDGICDGVAVCVGIWLSVEVRVRSPEIVCDGLMVPLRVFVAVCEGV